MFFDRVPLWVLFLATIGLATVAIEVGGRLGKRRQRRTEGKFAASSAMIGATIGLLSFMLAFTFNGAAGRHDVRKGLLIEEVNAIETTWLRAGFLDEPYRTDTRVLLRDYVDVRMKAGTGDTDDSEEQASASQAMQSRLWAVAEEAGRKNPRSITTGLFIQSLNQIIDVHLKRVMFGLRYRVPTPIWATLYLLLAVGMAMMGTQSEQGGSREHIMELALAVSFSLVLAVIADLDRPKEGLINVSQQAMQELQVKMHGR
jgi:hypothetical protein